MDAPDLQKTVREIAALNAWERAAPFNWAVIGQLEDAPFIVSIALEKDKREKLLRGHLQLFPGLPVFRDFLLSLRHPDYGVAMGPADFPHFELIATPAGAVELFTYRPGFVPRKPSPDERRRLAPILYECLGVLMRLEEDPELAFRYKREGAMFARTEGLDGKWRDAPFRLPDPQGPVYTESVAVNKAGCDRAAKLPMEGAWEIDFVLFPDFRTPEPEPRFLYLLAAVDPDTMTRKVWVKLSVGEGPDALKKLWEGHAQRVLDAILAAGVAPAVLSVRSPRLARLLRPLGLQLPFKIVQHAQLPALDAAIRDALKSNTL